MKPIIVEMNEMSDSVEIYDSKPNRFMIYTIYAVLLTLLITLVWMIVSKIDIVVKCNGFFKSSAGSYEISNEVAGKVKEICAIDGQYVEEGELLCVIDVDTFSDTIVEYQNKLENSQYRLEILNAYENSLYYGVEELEKHSDNPYYDEFVNKRKLFDANIALNVTDTNGQSMLYQESIDSISKSIEYYREKIKQLNKVKQCISTKSNTIASSDSYYYSIVNSYLSTYNYTCSEYDNRVDEIQKQIDEYDEKIAESEKSESKKTSSDNTVEIGKIDIKLLKEQREALTASIESVKREKKQALTSLKLQQETSIEQQISGYNDTILSLESNLMSAKLQKDELKREDEDLRKRVSVLTEKANIAEEILLYQDKVEECENYLKKYDFQNNKCLIKAGASGYYYAAKDLKVGTYIQQGIVIGAIYPEQETKYYAQIYVENQDVAKLKEGQQVKFEIAAFPSSEYGYFTGNVENIAKDITVDQSTGVSYYLVKVSCDSMTVMNEEGEEVSLKNGMACQAKIIVDKQSVVNYVLEKVELLD